MQLGILGGSFDPPHVGHAMVCLYALATGGIDRVLWIPTCAHPLGKDLLSFEHRLAMSRLAAEPLGDKVDVLDLEARLPQPNYTVETLRHLSKEYAGHQLRLIVGSDILAEQEKWRDFAEVERLAPPLVIARLGYAQVPGRAFMLPQVDSHAIRQRLANDQPVDDQLSAAVLAYIHEHGLYRQAPSERP
ncbi:nicotinate-nicotinamide nucleotide adenylyltransferase [Candidatus Sumerlaeota bacterium]